MMLRINGEFLDFNGDVDMEKRVKLFEEIDETLGDFSYSFRLEKTSKNLRLIGYPFPDVKDKTIYRESNCDLMDESGIVIYKGVLRVDRINIAIETSFFSGNYNWIRLINGSLKDLDFSELDTELDEFNIANTWDNTEGIIFPIIDAGGLITRSYRSLMIEDFTGCIFVKDVFKKIFADVSIKTRGDLFKDPTFDTMLLCRNTKSNEDIEARSTYAAGTSDYVFAVPGPGQTEVRIPFQNDSSYPYFDGSKNNFDVTTDTYTADVKMRGVLQVSLSEITDVGLSTVGTAFYLQIFTNNINTYNYRIPLAVGSAPFGGSVSVDMTLEAGDFIDARLIVVPGGGIPGTVTIDTSRTFKFTPSFVYFTAGNSLVPPWAKGDFISNVLSLCCGICDYNPYNKTLTIDIFDKIKTKEPIDLSEYIEVYEYDYEEFISSFGQSTLLSYQEANIDEIKEYNISQFVKYGSGEIVVDNDYIEKTATIVDSDFRAPISYINGPFSASLERVSFVEIEEQDTSEFTSVTDSAGAARFIVPDDSIYESGKLVRITESSLPGYNGDYVIKSTGSGSGFIILIGVDFTATATGKITKLIHNITNDDSVYLFLSTQYSADVVSKYSRLTDYYIGLNQYPNVAYAFFNMLNTADCARRSRLLKPG